MSHQAIARKWRPQVFADVSGQIHVTRTLQNALRLKKIHHAYLLTGARGVGKTSAARILARALNCEKGPGPDPCNECRACQEMLAGNFPDLQEIDAASHNSVDDIRDLVDKVRYTPQRGRYKIYVIDEVHMVSKAGFNALLKTLEEPPPHVIFILATTDPQQLLETVVSRCQRYDFKMIPVRTVFERLKEVAAAEGVAVPESSLMMIAREGGGSMRDAQSLLDQVMSFSDGAVSEQEVGEILGFIDRSILLDVAQATFENRVEDALLALQRVTEFGFDARTFANQLLETVRNTIVLRWIKEPQRMLDLPDDEIQRLQAMSRACDPDALQQRFDLLAEAIDSIARSEQPRLLLEMAVVRMASVRPYVPAELLVERLLDLERRLGRGAVAPAARPTASPGGRVLSDSRPISPLVAPAPSVGPPVVTPAPPSGPPPPPALSTPTHAGSAPSLPPPPAPHPVPPTGPRVGDGFSSVILGYRRGDSSAPGPANSTPPTMPGFPAPRAATTAPAAPPPSPAPSLTPPAPVAVQPPAQAQPSPTVAPAAAAPGVAPPAADRPDPPGSALCDAPRWRRFVHHLGKQDGQGPTVAVLSRGGFLGEDGGTVRVGFRSEVSLRAAERLADSPDFLLHAKDWFDQPLRFSFVPDPDGRGARTLAEEMDRLRSERLADMDSRARGHEAVTRLLAQFPGARVESIQLPEHVEITDVG